jgi:glutamine---fructose-6-phosphate transaminase (isomerizing)
MQRSSRVGPMPEDPGLGRPLPGAPDPWVASSMPELLSAPPYLMARMIAAEAGVAVRVAARVRSGSRGRELADVMAGVVDRGEPITTTGCGTSEHAALATAALLAAAMPPDRAHLVRCWQALDLVRAPQRAGLLIGVSHEGGTAATNQAIQAGRSAGARTAIITVSARSPGGIAAETAIETGEQDQSWCHTVGYLSPIVAAAGIADLVRDRQLDEAALGALVSIAAEQESLAREVAARLATCDRLFVVGAGIDLISARELALKIEEGSGLPASAIHLETLLHGHLAAADPSTGLVVILTDAEPAGEVVRMRARDVLRSAKALDMPAAAIVGARIGAHLPAELAPAGRLTAPEANAVPPLVEALIGAAIPLQLLALHLAMARGRNPDAIGRDDPRQATAAG